MRIAGCRYRDEWLPNFYPSRQVGDRFVRVARHGKTQLLTASEDAQLSELYMDSELFQRLEQTGHIITANNCSAAIPALQTWFKGMCDGPQLHILVATKRCNLDCAYCHMNPEPISSSKNSYDLQPETARHIIRFVLESPNPRIMIEFQGGEAFLNFPIIQYVVEETRRQNRLVGKEIRFSVVTNLMVATDDQMAFCRDHGVAVSYSLNGPRKVHDFFRVARNGAGSYEVVMRRIDHFMTKFPGLLSTSPLCVVGNDNMAELRSMIDFYHDAGFTEVSITYLKNLGNAVKRGLSFHVKEFMKHYLDALDFIYEKNKTSDTAYSERLLKVALMKILASTDVPYVDWQNPIGYVTGSIVYDYDGTILPADEARSMKAQFSMGSVIDRTYKSFVSDKETFKVVNLSVRDRDPECRECAYNPLCGVSPINYFAKTGQLVPKPYETDECHFVLSIFDWVFKRMMEDPIPLVRMLPGFLPHLHDIVKKPSNASAQQ